MTNTERFTTEQLARLDQQLADYDRAVDQFVQQAGTQVYLEGRPVGIAVLAEHLATQLDEDQLATVAAIALVRLAEQRQVEGGEL